MAYSRPSSVSTPKQGPGPTRVTRPTITPTGCGSLGVLGGAVGNLVGRVGRVGWDPVVIGDAGTGDGVAPSAQPARSAATNTAAVADLAPAGMATLRMAPRLIRPNRKRGARDVHPGRRPFGSGSGGDPDLDRGAVHVQHLDLHAHGGELDAVV